MNSMSIKRVAERVLPGELDTTFNSTGEVHRPFSGAGLGMSANQDRVCLTSRRNIGADNAVFEVWVTSMGGQLLKAVEGRFSAAGFPGYARAVELPDGRFLVYGRDDHTPPVGGRISQVALAMYDQNLELVQNFGNAGVLLLDLEGVAAALVVPIDVALVPRAGGNEVDFLVVCSRFAWKVTNGGELDTDFGSGGRILFHPGPQSSARATSVTVLRDGKILLAGALSESANADHHAYVRRVDAQGRPDASFATYRDTSAGNPSEIGLLVLPNDKLLVYYKSPLTYCSMRMLNADGSLDTGFHEGEELRWPVTGDLPGGLLSRWVGATPGKDGAIFLIGETPDGLIMASVTAQGTPDAAFAPSGYKRLGTAYVVESYAHFQPDGKAMVSLHRSMNLPGVTFQPFFYRYHAADVEGGGPGPGPGGLLRLDTEFNQTGILPGPQGTQRSTSVSAGDTYLCLSAVDEDPTSNHAYYLYITDYQGVPRVSEPATGELSAEGATLTVHGRYVPRSGSETREYILVDGVCLVFTNDGPSERFAASGHLDNGINQQNKAIEPDSDWAIVPATAEPLFETDLPLRASDSRLIHPATGHSLNATRLAVATVQRDALKTWIYRPCRRGLQKVDTLGGFDAAYADGEGYAPIDYHPGPDSLFTSVSAVVFPDHSAAVLGYALSVEQGTLSGIAVARLDARGRLVVGENNETFTMISILSIGNLDGQTEIGGLLRRPGNGTVSFLYNPASKQTFLIALNDQGVYDPHFVSGHELRMERFRAFAGHVDAAGAITLVGARINDAGEQLDGVVLASVLADGTLDKRFGEYGISDRFGKGVGVDVTVQANGRILVASRVDEGPYFMRFTLEPENATAVS